MDTRFLESFVEVSEHGSLAEAARRLGITPAAVAQRIRALEAELGCRLLTRAGRVVQPTEAGFAILARSRTFLREIRDLRTVAAAPATAGELTVGAVSTAITGLVPQILNEVIAEYPRVQVYIEPATSIELYSKVLDGDLDAAILVQPRFPLPKTCELHTLRREALVLIAPASVDSRDPYQLLRTQPFVRYDRKHWGGRLADNYLKTTGIVPAERFELDSLEAIAVMVDRGLGISLVPDWAPPWPAGLSLIKIPVAAAAYERRIGLMSLRSSPRLRLIRAFTEAALRMTQPSPGPLPREA